MKVRSFAVLASFTVFGCSEDSGSSNTQGSTQGTSTENVQQSRTDQQNSNGMSADGAHEIELSAAQASNMLLPSERRGCVESRVSHGYGRSTTGIGSDVALAQWAQENMGTLVDFSLLEDSPGTGGAAIPVRDGEYNFDVDYIRMAGPGRAADTTTITFCAWVVDNIQPLDVAMTGAKTAEVIYLVNYRPTRLAESLRARFPEVTLRPHEDRFFNGSHREKVAQFRHLDVGGWRVESSR